MRYFRWLPLTLMALWLLVCLLPVAAIVAHSSSQTATLGYPVAITHRGTAEQNGIFIGAGQQSGQAQTLSLGFADTNQSQALPISLPGDVSLADIGATFSSVQGTQNMRMDLVSPRQLVIELPPLLSDSHTSLQLRFPGDYFQFTPEIWLYSLVASTPGLDWATVGLLLLAASLLSLAPRRGLSKHTAIREMIQAPPANLGAVGMALLVHGGIRVKDMAALILDLARRGALEVINRDYEVYLLRHMTEISSGRPYEEDLLNLLIPAGRQIGRISDIILSINKELFSDQVSMIYNAAYEELSRSKLFVEDPRRSHLRLKTAGIVLQFTALGELIYLYLSQSPFLLGLACLGFAQYLAGYAFFRRSRSAAYLTPQGTAVWRDCQRFLSFLSYPASVPEELYQNGTFYLYLPYALIGEVDKEWARRFAEHSFYVPPWLTSAYLDIVSPQVMAEEVSTISNVLANAFALVKDPNVD